MRSKNVVCAVEHYWFASKRRIGWHWYAQDVDGRERSGWALSRWGAGRRANRWAGKCVDLRSV